MLASAMYSIGALMLPVEYKREMGARAERASTGGIGWSEVEAVTDITAAFNRADEKLGGGFGRTAVVEYLTTDVATYCEARSRGPIRSAMFSSAAQLAYLSGWKAHDIGREGLAQRYYLYAYQLAVESGDLGQAAYIMRILAHQAYDMGHSANCVALAGDAVRTGVGRVDAHTGALLTLTLAKAHAMGGGDRREVLAKITDAEALMSKAREGDDRPSWAGLHGLSPSQFNNHVAKILVDLGDYKGAEEHFSRSIKLYLNPTSQPRIYALTTTWLAETQAKRGHVEQACQSWADALSRMDGIQSARTQESVRTMKQMLTPYRQRGIPGVQRLLQTT
jgi:tetratricopeptide (TPR) repeat protein